MAVRAERDAGDESGVPAEDDELAPGGRVPDPRRAVVAGRGDEPAVGAEGDAVDESRMPAEGPDLRAARPRPRA